MQSSLRGVTPLAAGHPREFRKKQHNNKKTIFLQMYSGREFFCKQPCLTRSIRAALESPAESQGLPGWAGRGLGWCSQAVLSSQLWLIPPCPPRRAHRSCPHSAVPRLPSALRETRTLSRLQCYSSAKTFLLCERSKENKHLHLPSEHIQPNMHGIFIVEGSDL